MNTYLLKRFWLLAVCLAMSLRLAHGNELHEMIINGSDSTNVLKLLKTNPKLIESRDKRNCTPLHYAAQYDQVAVVKWLLKHKADVNAAAYDGYTPLYLTKDGEIARLLIKAHADLQRKDNWGRTPLQHAAQLKHTEVCDEILGSGFPIDLSSALILGRREDAKKIIRKKPALVKHVEPDADLWGNTSPLGIAAGNGDREMVALLLQAGAPVNAETDRPGLAAMTPLCNAVWGGHLEVAELLCDAGANCNVTGGKFYPNLLDFAMKHSEPAMIELLVKHGAQPGK